MKHQNRTRHNIRSGQINKRTESIMNSSSCKQMDFLIMLLFALIVGGSSDSQADLYSINNYLVDAVNTDIVFLIDVSENTSHHVEQFKELATMSTACIDSLQKVGTRAALITFGNSTKLEYKFDDECQTKNCLLRIINNIISRNENRRIGIALRHAKRILKDKRESDIQLYARTNKHYNRTQAIFLLTFGIGRKEENIPIAGRILSNGIDLIVIGLGEGAAQNQKFLQDLVDPNSSTVERRKEKNKKTASKTQTNNKNANSQEKKKLVYGKGLAYISKYINYVINMLKLGVQYSEACSPELYSSMETGE